MPYTGRSNLLKAIMAADLSPVTKKTYKDRGSMLKRETKRSLFYIASHPEVYIPWLEKEYPNVTSRKVYFSFILGLYKYNQGFAEQCPEAYKKYVEVFKVADQAVEARYKENLPSDRQKDGYVPFADIIKKRDSLRSGVIDKLLLGLYTYLPPIRCEYGRVALYKSNAMPASPDPNHIIDEKTLIISQFKTKRYHKPSVRELPKELTKELRMSLNLQPRAFLFVNRFGDPFTSNGYSRWAGDRLQELFGKPLTVTIIRHSFINTLDFNTLSMAEKEEIAEAMQHTVTTQDRYRLLFKDTGSEKDAAPTTSQCKWVCTKDKVK